MTITLNGSTGITTPDIDIAAGLDASDLTGALPAISGSALTSLTSANLTGALPAIDGAALTGIQTGPTYGTPVATTSGTAFDFTGIPAGVKEIKVYFDGVTLTANYELYVRVGTSSGFVGSGYSSSSLSATASVLSEYHRTDAFFLNTLTASAPATGVLVLTRTTQSGHVWGQSHSFGGPVRTAVGGGMVDAGAEITQLRVLPSSPTPTFTAGTLNISWSF